MKFLLIQPPIEDFYTTPIRLYPLGLLYAAAVLNECGQHVKILDCLNPLVKRQLPFPPDFDYLRESFRNNPYLFKNYFRFGLADKDIVKRIEEANPDMIGISSQFTAYFSSIARLSRLIKRHFDVPVFIGGHHASAFPQEIKKRCEDIDHVLIGPAEQSIPHYLRQYGKKSEQNSIDWKYLRPPHELLQMNDYKMGRRLYMSLTASRGCPFKCEFCSVHNMFGRRIVYRSVENVLSEMLDNHTRGIRIFNFEDDNLSFDRRWFRTFLESVIANPGLKDIELTASNGLCYPTLNEELLTLMYEAGFRRINLSFVTMDRTLRHDFKRPGPNSNLEQIINKAREIGFFVTVYIIIGLPSQTYDEVKKSIDYLLDLDVLVGPSVFYIPPASELYDKLVLPDELRRNWNMYRSSTFAVETEHLNRQKLLELFTYAREQNLARKKRRAL